MGREVERQFFGDRLSVARQDSMSGRAIDFLVVMDKDAIMQYGNISGPFELAVFEDRGIE